jgi:hypothetical protein
VTDVIIRACGTDPRDTLSKRVVSGDDAVGTQLRSEIVDDTRSDVGNAKYVRLQTG